MVKMVCVFTCLQVLTVKMVCFYVFAGADEDGLCFYVFAGADGEDGLCFYLCAGADGGRGDAPVAKRDGAK